MLLAFPATATQATTVELFRGASLGSPGYWAVADAYLDKAEPNEDHGGGFTLLGGDNRTILIRFGDLARVVGPHRRVVTATLVLTPSGGDVPKFKAATALDAPWGEGPWSSLSKIISNLESDPKGAKKPVAARGAATWMERRAGIAPWPTPGTPNGAPIEATGALKEKTFEISGLGPTVQGWIAKPWTNQGVALAFEGDVEFFSSQSPSGRPKLLLTTEPTPQIDVAQPDLAVASIAKTDGKWTARVRNVGAAVAPAGKATWWVDGKPVPKVDLKALASNEETTLAYAGPEPKEDGQVPSLALEVAAKGDAVSDNDRLDVFVDAKPVKLALAPTLDPQAVVGYWNETVAPLSRFSFAPEGAKARIRLESASVATDGAATLADALRQIGRQLGLPAADGRGDLYPGLMGYGDTRFDGTIPGRLALPYEPYPDPATEASLLEPNGLLSATDVGRLNDPSGPLPLPKVVFLQATDLSGRPLSGVKLTLEPAGGSATTIVTGPGGAALLPSALLASFKPDLSNGSLTVRASQGGVTATTRMKAWRLSDAYRRSGLAAVTLPIHLDLPMLPLESETDLAREKLVADSKGTDPAKLVAITDGDPVTAASLPAEPGGWIEIDLGRDRTIGEIALRPGPGAFWDRYDILVSGTGQRREDATTWASELNSAWARENRSPDGWITYRSPVQRIRFVRIVAKAGGAASLAEVRVVPVRLQGGTP